MSLNPVNREHWIKNVTLKKEKNHPLALGGRLSLCLIGTVTLAGCGKAALFSEILLKFCLHM